MTNTRKPTDLVNLALRHATAVASGASVFALGSAYGSQYLGGLAPCILCLYQRIPYAVVIVLGVIAMVLKARGHENLATKIVPVAGAAFLAGAGIAGFHVGVEQQWWQGTTECVGSTGATTLQGLEAQILSTPVTLCNEIAWSLFGVSMAGYNLLASLALAAFCFLATARAQKS